jgi:hypothetical protein
MALSAEEQAQLDEWYAQQDQRESDALARVTPPEELVQLRQQVDPGLAELQSVAQRVLAIASENQSLKQEIATLQRRLNTNAQPA